MLTYEYYKDIFLGEADETTFNKYLIEATIEYQNYTLKPKLTEHLLTKEHSAIMIKTCICVMIDNLIKKDKLLDLASKSDQINALGISSESVKDHNVSFKADKGLSTNNVEKQTELTNVSVMNKYLLSLGLLNRGLR